MSLSPEIALAMPIGSWHPFLPLVLRGLENQRLPLQLAILDASGDQRVERALEESNLTFLYTRKGADMGQSAAIIEGWENTDAPFIGWLNTDDILFSGALKIMLCTIKELDLDVVFGDSCILNADGETVGVHGQVNEVDRNLLLTNCISQPSTLIRRRTMDQVGGLNTSLKFTMDWDLWIRIYKAGGKFHKIDKVLSAVYWGDKTKTSQISVRRMNEIYNISRRSNSFYQALKTVVSAARQQINYDKKVDSGQKACNQTPGIFLTADCHPNEEGTANKTISVINTNKKPCRKLVVNWHGSTPKIECNQSVDQFEIRSNHVQIQLSAEVPCAFATQINIVAKNDGHTRFLCGKFLKN